MLIEKLDSFPFSQYINPLDFTGSIIDVLLNDCALITKQNKTKQNKIIKNNFFHS